MSFDTRRVFVYFHFLEFFIPRLSPEAKSSRLPMAAMWTNSATVAEKVSSWDGLCLYLASMIEESSRNIWRAG
jgi:hypothetical protein